MDNRTLHIKRLREGLDRIQEFKQGADNAWSSNFRSWNRRTAQSLKTLFGKDDDYYMRFIALHFWETRASLMSDPIWMDEDQLRFYDDLSIAESIISDALEELEIEPAVIEKPFPEPTKSKKTPQIVVNVYNALSQTTEVQISQIMNSLDDLDLAVDKRAEVEKLAEEIETEAKGKKRWSVLAKSLDALKGMGKAIYERVAIPLLLEMLKKEAGL